MPSDLIAADRPQATRFASVGCSRADIAQGMRLKQIAGWNQTYADWARFLTLEPSGCYVAERASLVVGTVTTCRFYSVAWIGMMLVDPAHRRAGHCDALDATRSRSVGGHAGVERIRLDATEMGIPLYRRLGFLPQLEIARYGGNPTRLASRSRLPRRARFPVEGLAGAIRVGSRGIACGSHEATQASAGASRRHGTSRVGRGPFAGFSAGPSGELRSSNWSLCSAWRSRRPRVVCRCPATASKARVLVDIPLENPSANDAAREAGLSVQRVFVRMCRGGPCHELIPSFWAGSGPEKG